jgi:hypothetical protein
MHAIVASDTLDARTLTPAQIDRYSAELEQLATRIFGGPNAAVFGQHILRGRFGDAVVRRYFDADGHLVGLNAILATELELDGGPCTVFRGLLGLLPAYRGGIDVVAFWVETVLRYRLRHPRRRLFVFSPIASAAAYRTLARRTDDLYPHPHRPTPPAIDALISRLSAHLGYARLAGEHPYVVERATWVRDEVPRSAASRDAFGEFFHRLNPRAAEGKSLLVLVPVTPRSLAGAAVRCARAALRRAWNLRPALTPSRA